MKKFRMQWVLFGVNVSIGIVSSLVIAVGGQVLGISSLSWSTIIYSGGVFTFILIGTHRLVFSTLILHPLQQLIQMIKFSRFEKFSPDSFPVRIRELDDLAQLLDSICKYSEDLARRSYELLERGGRQEITLRTETDIMGKAFQKLVSTVSTLENLIEEVTKGALCIDIPESLLETKLGQVFRSMYAEIRESIVNVRKEVINISSVSAKIAAMSQQGSRNATMETRAIERISASINQVVNNLRKVMQNIEVQGDSLEKTFADIKHMLASIDEVNESVELLSSSAEETSRSIGKIHKFMQEIDTHAHSLSEISETISTEATDGLQAVGEVIDGIQTIKSTVEEAATVIQQLGDESGRIGEILEVINSIAEQTNLLALNASIIAAQAGEHGRGFAVVAGEVRELAERTRASTQEIGGIIRSLQTKVTHGTTAMKHCLEAVGEGVKLANHSGTILEKIVGSIQGARKMASSLAEATVIQTTNSEQVKKATIQVSQKVGELYATATRQAKGSAHLAEMANLLKDITQDINQSAVAQLNETDAIAQSISNIQDLLNRNAKMTHELAGSSSDLGILESNLADNMGHFLLTGQQLPPDFDQDRPTIAFVRHGRDIFFSDVDQGVQNVIATEKYQHIEFGTGADPVEQAENISWLLRQHWLKGIVLAPVNENTGSRLVANVMKHKIAIVVVDFRVKNADVSVVSDNTRGGEYAAEILREKFSGESTVLVFGSRNLYSLACRMSGFFEKAKSYQWTVIEIFSPADDINEAKKYIQEGLNLFPNAQGVFLTNETTVLAYLELLYEGKFSKRMLYAVGFDMTSDIAKAIADGYLLGTITQDPVQLGSTATQELLNLLRHGHPEAGSTPEEILVPVKKVTRDKLSSDS